MSIRNHKIIFRICIVLPVFVLSKDFVNEIELQFYDPFLHMYFSVFKIFDIADGEFVERMNLRVGRSLNLNFSAADVTWNPIDGGYNTEFPLLFMKLTFAGVND